MTQDDRIKCSVEYPGLWLGMEVSLAPGEDPIATFIRTKATVDAAYKAMTGGQSMPSFSSIIPETQIQKQSEDIRIANMIADINACTTIPKPDGLESFWLGVQQSGNQQIMDAYLLKLKELQ